LASGPGTHPDRCRWIVAGNFDERPTRRRSFVRSTVLSQDLGHLTDELVRALAVSLWLLVDQRAHAVLDDLCRYDRCRRAAATTNNELGRVEPILFECSDQLANLSSVVLG
jgi:hypothetical protein